MWITLKFRLRRDLVISHILWLRIWIFDLYHFLSAVYRAEDAGSTHWIKSSQ